MTNVFLDILHNEMIVPEAHWKMLLTKTIWNSYLFSLIQLYHKQVFYQLNFPKSGQNIVSTDENIGLDHNVYSS